MKSRSKSLAALVGFLFSCLTHAYEINNHADMSQQALLISSLGTGAGPNGKLFRIGVKPLDVQSTDQKFSLDASLGPIPYCFGSISPRDADPTRAWRVTIPLNDPYFPSQQAGNGVGQPGNNWTPEGGDIKLTIAQFIRYGACYEDEEHPAKSVAHFYNPQADGQAANVLSIPLGPNSLEWMLKRGADTVKSGDRPYNAGIDFV